MNQRTQSVYERAFDRIFLELRSMGLSEKQAIDMADREANDAVDRYCDEKFHLRKEGG